MNALLSQVGFTGFLTLLSAGLNAGLALMYWLERKERKEVEGFARQYAKERDISDSAAKFAEEVHKDQIERMQNAFIYWRDQYQKLEAQRTDPKSVRSDLDRMLQAPPTKDTRKK